MARSRKTAKVVVPGSRLLADLRGMIAEARLQVARSVDSTLVLLYWRLGRRIREDILEEKRAAYGEEIVATLSRQLGWGHFVQMLPIQDRLKRDF